MSVDYEIEVNTQNSVYNKLTNKLSTRKLKVYFSVPENGVNEDTGLLLFIAGYGGKASSNVYKKMRSNFSDKYNLVSIQCDYFGYEFMQLPKKILIDIDKKELSRCFKDWEIEKIYEKGNLDFNTFVELGSKYNINVNAKENLKETIDNFNDMGLMQSLDNITAVLNVMNILYDNNCCFNSRKVIIYGHSHGAYLAYLCNAFSPKLFSLIIDNSAWLKPFYLLNNRHCYDRVDKLILTVNFDYLVKKVIDDLEIFDIENLYSKFSNKSKVISYHGVDDNLINCKDKFEFCKNANNCTYIEISQEDVDGIVFKSTKHGLDADFIELFDYTMNNLPFEFEKDYNIDLQNRVVFQTSKHKYIIDYTDIIPKIYIT